MRAAGIVLRPLMAGGLLLAAVLLGAAPAVAASGAGPSGTSGTASSVATRLHIAAVRTAPRSGLSVALPDSPVLTLPTGDGFRDSLPAIVVARSAGRIDLLAVASDTSVVVARRVRLLRSGSTYSARIRVPVRPLRRGTWTIRVRRSDAHAVGATAPTPLRVGSGAVTSVVVVPGTRTLYPYRDGYRDALTASVRALDETGTVLPAVGDLRLSSGGRSTIAEVRGPATRLSSAGLAPGRATLRASMTGPSGIARRSGPIRITLKPTGITAVALVTSAAVVEPVVDDRADTVAITVSGTTTIGKPVTIAGSITITGSGGTAKRWTFASPGRRTVVWDGRVAGRIVPGTYTVAVSMRGPEGTARTRSTTIAVSADHLPYRMRTLFSLPSGNQQGLAVHGGTYYIATDLGNGTARIGEYDEHGVAIGSIGPLPIGHAAELAYSSVTDRLYAANGGFTDPTSVYVIDPATGTMGAPLDLKALGPNGMVASDDANSRLVVFAGQSATYTVSFVDPATGSVTATLPVSIEGLPQGLEVVGRELWVYSSLPSGNRITRFTIGGTVADPQVTPVAGDAGVIALAALGEGEGMALAPGAGVSPSADAPADPAHPWSGVVVLGAHHPNRIAVLEAVPDE